MYHDIQSLCLEYIKSEWQKLEPLHLRDEPLLMPPWGVWIRQHSPILQNCSEIDQGKPIQRTWFMDKYGIQERNPWSYLRFVTVNWKCPWAAHNFRPQMTIWGKYHQIGLAAFAKMKAENGIYIETQWGIRYGQGYQMRINGQGELEKEKHYGCRNISIQNKEQAKLTTGGGQ